jgi:hypothetical protein
MISLRKAMNVLAQAIVFAAIIAGIFWLSILF